MLTHHIICVLAVGTLGNVCVCLLSRFVNFTVRAADSRQVVASVLKCFGCEELETNCGHRLYSFIFEAADFHVCLHICFVEVCAWRCSCTLVVHKCLLEDVFVPFTSCTTKHVGLFA